MILKSIMGPRPLYYYKFLASCIDLNYENDLQSNSQRFHNKPKINCSKFMLSQALIFSLSLFRV